MNDEELRKLAVEWVCPLGGEPQTIYEKNMVNNLIQFGREVESRLTQRTADKGHAYNHWDDPNDGISTPPTFA
jgi:hypothetical protein